MLFCSEMEQGTSYNDIIMFFYIPLKIYKTNYLLHYLLITLRNTTRTIIPRGAIDYDNLVAINIERNKNYWVNQRRCTTRPQSRTQEPPTDSHNLSRIDGASKRLKRSYAQASVEKFEKYGTNRACGPAPRLPEQAAPLPRPTHYIKININTIKKSKSTKQNFTDKTLYDDVLGGCAKFNKL